MKRHHKTPKMSRIRVAALKKRKMLENIKNYPNNRASQNYKKHVINCTIGKPDESLLIDIKLPWGTVKGTKWQGWKIPKNGYPQCKSLHKRIHGQKWIKYKDGTFELKKWDYPSEYPNTQNYQNKLWKNLSKAAKMELYVQNKLKKWEKKHLKPCSDDDAFKDEFIPKWESEREQALIRIRDFVVSMFDKLPLTGRFKQSDKEFKEEPIAEIKDINGEGHRVNELDKSSKLIKKAQKITNEVHAKRTNLVCTNLKDHKRQKGRIILPKAA